MNEIIIAVICFLVIQLILVTFIFISRKKLVPSGAITIRINDEKEIETGAGGKLLGVLSDNEIYVPSACGGGATCGQCRVVVKEGGGGILPSEQSLIKKNEERAGVRLACQVPVKHDMDLQLPAEVLESRKWLCRVRSNHNVATFIKELILELPEGEEISFKPGSYIQVEIPAYTAKYSDYVIEEEFKEDWIKFHMLQYVSKVKEPEFRAYSMANYPSEKGIVMLNIRIASPPPRGPQGIPPGKVSSYIFNLIPGDEVTISGPFGTFFIEDSDAEMIYVGGGAGMAPLRSQIFHLFKDINTGRKVSFWYGGRSMKEVFYQEEFDKLAAEFDNFTFNIALSDPQPEDNWQGYSGFIHQILYDNYLRDHSAPEDIQYYMCGPPMMAKAVVDMLDDLGVEAANIHFDDFGG